MLAAGPAARVQVAGLQQQPAVPAPPPMGQVRGRAADCPLAHLLAQQLSKEASSPWHKVSSMVVGGCC